MFKLALSTFLLITFCHIALCAKLPSIEEAYYWRKYNGKVPSDAFIVGRKNDGNLMYIAQVLFQNLLIPGEIVQDNVNVNFEWGGRARFTVNNTMIFCTKDPTDFKWIPYVASAPVNNYVVGGFEPHNNVFIGRATHGDETVLGKVVISKQFATWLHTVYKDKVIRFENFEILSFDPQPKTAFLSNKIMDVSADTENKIEDISFSGRNRDCYGGNVVINFN